MQAKRNISATQNKSYIVVQLRWYTTILTGNTTSNTAKFAKMVHPVFVGEDSGRYSPLFEN